MSETETSAAYFLVFVCDYNYDEAMLMVRQANYYNLRYWAKLGSDHGRRAFRNLRILLTDMTLCRRLPSPRIKK